MREFASCAAEPDTEFMGKGSRLRRERTSETHEPRPLRDWPDGHVRVDLANADRDESIIVTVHDMRHHLLSTTAQVLNERLAEKIKEWDRDAKARGADGLLPPEERHPRGMGPFDSQVIAGELAHARVKSRDMVRGTLRMFGPHGEVTRAHFPFLGFIERAQAFHLGVITMVESGNPLGAATLLRSFAENLAVVFYVNAHPAEFEKLQPNAQHGFPMGRVIAEAEKNLPGYQSMYKNLSSMAHPSGAGAFQTLRVGEDRSFTWQSHPTFKDVADAREILKLLDELGDLIAQVIRQTAQQFELGTGIANIEDGGTQR